MSRVMAERVRGALAALERRQGRRKRPESVEPLDAMVELLIRSFTGERLSRNAIRNLRRDFVDWNEVRAARQLEVARTLESAGLEESLGTAQRLQDMLRAIYNERGNLELRPLLHGPTSEIRSFLSALEPLGKELTPVALLLAFNQSVMPVSEDVLRVHRRLGWVSATATAAQVRRSIEDSIEGDEPYRYYLAVTQLAERICRPEEPLCLRCPLKRDCRYRLKHT